MMVLSMLVEGESHRYINKNIRVEQRRFAAQRDSTPSSLLLNYDQRYPLNETQISKQRSKMRASEHIDTPAGSPAGLTPI